MKTTRCLGIVESSYKSKKERGSGHSCFVSGFVKAGVCVVCPTFSSLPQEGGTPPVFKEEDTPIFESNEHLHWLTPFLEFMDLNRKKKKSTEFVRRERFLFKCHPGRTGGETPNTVIKSVLRLLGDSRVVQSQRTAVEAVCSSVVLWSVICTTTLSDKSRFLMETRLTEEINLCARCVLRFS